MQKLKDTFAGFWKYRYLLQNLISRDFKLKYRRSVLGVAWSVLNPLLTCLVMWAVFGALFNQRGQGIEDFPLFLIIGQLMFPNTSSRWKSAALRSSTSFSAS